MRGCYGGPIMKSYWKVFLFYNLRVQIGSLSDPTLLKRGRQPEVNVSHAKTIVSPRFLN